MSSDKKADKHGDGHGKKGKGSAAGNYMIPAGHSWAGLWKLFAGISVVGLAMAGVGFSQDPKHFAFSYLTAFMWGLTIALGALFFVLLQHITRAGWSVVVRRGAEQLMGTLPFFAVLFAPIPLLAHSLYPWLDHEFMHHNPTVEAKAGYLNMGFWAARAVVYFAIWAFLSHRLLSLSTEQDKTRAPDLTNKMGALSAPGIPLFGLSLTFAAFDWVMSLDPAWYSTMFGVYFFSGAVVSVLAFLNLLFTRMQSAGLLTKEVTEEHYHDLGKLMFAFTVFWAYIAFSQYMLIWYANIPEETLFFMHRGTNGWEGPSWLLVFGHFFFPFFLMLSRNTKRIPAARLIGATWILIMHYIDIYWVVMPNVDHHFHFNFITDLGCWLFIAGALFAVAFFRMAASPILPTGDPRLSRSLRFENA